MNKKSKALASLLILAVITTLMTGCATFNNFKSAFFGGDQTQEDTVRIGVFEPLSGEDKAYGELEKKGIELAHELYPTALGKNVELIYGDNKSDIYVAEEVIQDLIEKRPSVVLGSYGSVYSLVAVKYLEEAKIPGIAITNTNPLVTSNNPYYFRVCFVDSYQGVAVAKYAVEEMKVSTAAVMKPVLDDAATAVSQTFSDKIVQLTENPYAVVTTQEYTAGDEDFTAQLEKIRDSGAQVVFLPAKISDAATILRQARQMKLSAVFLGTEDWESEEFIKLAGKEAVENVAFSTVFDPESGITEMTDVFLKAYREKYGEDSVPDPAVALGFDAYLIAIDSLNRIGTALNGELLQQSILLEKEFPGASGSITFDNNGDPIKSVVIKKIKDGEFVNAYTVEPVWVVLGDAVESGEQ